MQRVFDHLSAIWEFRKMPRLAILDAPGVLHHIMGRGMEGNRMFITIDWVKNSNCSRQYRDCHWSVVKKQRRGAGSTPCHWIHFKNKCFYLLKETEVINRVRSGSRRHRVVNATQVLFWYGVRELGYSGAEVARYLGMSTSCVNRFISSEKKPDADFNIHA